MTVEGCYNDIQLVISITIIYVNDNINIILQLHKECM
jgi:hypothetical protein